MGGGILPQAFLIAVTFGTKIDNILAPGHGAEPGRAAPSRADPGEPTRAEPPRQSPPNQSSNRAPPPSDRVIQINLTPDRPLVATYVIILKNPSKVKTSAEHSAENFMKIVLFA